MAQVLPGTWQSNKCTVLQRPKAAEASRYVGTSFWLARIVFWLKGIVFPKYGATDAKVVKATNLEGAPLAVGLTEWWWGASWFPNFWWWLNFKRFYCLSMFIVSNRFKWFWATSQIPLGARTFCRWAGRRRTPCAWKLNLYLVDFQVDRVSTFRMPWCFHFFWAVPWIPNMDW